MSVLLIGGTGLLSTGITCGLVAAGHDVTCFTRGKTDSAVPDSVDFVHCEVSGLGRRLNLPVSTVHSHLATLVECEHLTSCNENYDIGYRFLEVGGHRRACTLTTKNV